MLLVGSDNARVGFADGMRILRRGGRALDAVEATIRRVEANPTDHSVGVGGLPNIAGEVELDASLIDGRTLEAGAVCAVRGFPHVISLARQVMGRLPHVLVAGAGAERLARELGMPRKQLLTAAARATYARKVTGRLGRRGRLIDRSGRDPRPRDRRQLHGLLRHRERDRDRPARRHRQRCQHQRLGLEVPGPGGRLAAYRRRQLRRQPLWGLRLHRLRRNGDPQRDRSLGRALHEDGAVAGARRPRGDDGPAPPHRPLPATVLLAVSARGGHVGLTTATTGEVRYAYQTGRMDTPATRPRQVVPLMASGRGRRA